MMASEPAVAIGIPWITIWAHPRATIRRIVDTDPRHQAVFLATLAGALSGLESAWSQPPTPAMAGIGSWPMLVVVSVVAGGILGAIGLYINGAVLKWSGALLGGVASFAEVRAALAWGQIPAIVAMALGIISILLGAGTPLIGLGEGSMRGPSAGTILFNAALGLWSFVITLKCLGEVHRFSAWRALGAIAVVAAIAIAVVVGVLLIASGAGKILHPAFTV
jgi:Yip1 domain